MWHIAILSLIYACWFSVPSKFIKSIQSHQAFSLVDNTTESGIRIGRALAQRSCNQSHITRTSRQASIYKFISIDSSENGQHVVKQSGGPSLFRLATDANQEHYSTSIANRNSTYFFGRRRIPSNFVRFVCLIFLSCFAGVRTEFHSDEYNVRLMPGVLHVPNAVWHAYSSLLFSRSEKQYSFVCLIWLGTQQIDSTSSYILLYSLSLSHLARRIIKFTNLTRLTLIGTLARLYRLVYTVRADFV